MKKSFFAILLGLLIFTSISVNAQTASASASATATACIITPLTITKKTDMNFGNVVAGSGIGTVVLTTTGTRSSTGGVILPSAIPGTISGAKFETTGTPNQTYSITLPASATLTSSSNTMTVNTFNSTPTISHGGNLGSDGKEDIFVGATLNVAATQAAGTYVGSFTVTVAYN